MRMFVCQGCGKAVAVLYGRSMICGCGTKSSAEILAPDEVSPTIARLIEETMATEAAGHTKDD